MSETSARPLRILHLTDTHLYGDDSLHYGVVDTAGMLADTLRHLTRLRELDLVVCSGDVSEDGSAESYRRAAAALEPWARARGARVVYAMGNHDARGAFRAVLGDGQSGPAASTAGPAGPVLSAGVVRGHRVVVLDSSVPRAGYGRLGPDQLDWLRLELATPAEHGTVLVVHHQHRAVLGRRRELQPQPVELVGAEPPVPGAGHGAVQYDHAVPAHDAGRQHRARRAGRRGGRP